MLTGLIIACIVVVAVVGLTAYAIRSKSGRLKLSAKVAKIVDFSLEFDPKDSRAELRPPGNRGEENTSLSA